MPSERRATSRAGHQDPALALEPQTMPSGSLDGLRRRAQRWWKEQTALRIEDEVVDASDSRGVSRYVLPLIAPLMLVPAILLVREPENHVAAATLVAGAAALLYAMLGSTIERRVKNPFWISLANAAVYSGAITALLWTFVMFEHPREHVHWVIFFLYFLLIGSTGLSNDPRQSVCAGAFSILGYLTVVMLVWAEIAEGGSAMAQRVAPQFEWVANSAKIAVLVGATILAAASSQRGRDLRRASLRDGLTGLLNRHAFDQCLEHLALRAEQRGVALTVAMIDIDHFKDLNDSNGHQAGDDVLRWVAGWLQRSFRATDLVARYGGEEFVVAFPNSDDERLLQRLQAFQRGITEASVRSLHAEDELRVTVSVGAARMPDDAESIHEVLAVADQRLYAAKRQGRDRLVTHDEPAADPQPA